MYVAQVSSRRVCSICYLLSLLKLHTLRTNWLLVWVKTDDIQQVAYAEHPMGLCRARGYGRRGWGGSRHGVHVADAAAARCAASHAELDGTTPGATRHDELQPPDACHDGPEPPSQVSMQAADAVSGYLAPCRTADLLFECNPLPSPLAAESTVAMHCSSLPLVTIVCFVPSCANGRSSKQQR